jgi:hypothetical protein
VTIRLADFDVDWTAQKAGGVSALTLRSVVQLEYTTGTAPAVRSATFVGRGRRVDTGWAPKIDQRIGDDISAVVDEATASVISQLVADFSAPNCVDPHLRTAARAKLLLLRSFQNSNSRYCGLPHQVRIAAAAVCASLVATAGRARSNNCELPMGQCLSANVLDRQPTEAARHPARYARQHASPRRRSPEL